MISKISIPNLLIIADDLGLYESVNDGIIFLIKEKKINGASLMANGEYFDDAIQKLKSINTFNVGVHFVLVEETSLSGLKLSKNYKIFFIKYIFGLIKLAEIENELRAQLERIVNSGITPKFINSHQHLHLLPGITNIVIKLAKEYGISYIRTVSETVSAKKYNLLRFLQMIFLMFLSRSLKNKLKKSGLEFNDLFVGFMNVGKISEKDLRLARKVAEKCPKKIIELGCHPGYEKGGLREKYKNWGGYSWEQELRTLLNSDEL